MRKQAVFAKCEIVEAVQSTMPQANALSTVSLLYKTGNALTCQTCSAHNGVRTFLSCWPEQRSGVLRGHSRRQAGFRVLWRGGFAVLLRCSRRQRQESVCRLHSSRSQFFTFASEPLHRWLHHGVRLCCLHVERTACGLEAFQPNAPQG